MLKIEIDFVDALIDIDRIITVQGAAPYADISLRTKTERAGHIWRSQSTYQADENGLLELKTTSQNDQHSEQQALALIYGQQAENAATTALVNSMVYQPIQTEIEASSGGIKAIQVLTQRLLTDAVQRVEINEDELQGVLFVPTSPLEKGAIIVLKEHTSSALDEAQAALYAARGYICFALNYNELHLQQDPLLQAKMVRALKWLRETMRPKHDFVAVSGYRDGADLALGLGIKLANSISAVIACEAMALAPTLDSVELLQGPLLVASCQLHSSHNYNMAVAQRLQNHGFDYRFQWYDFEGLNQGLRYPHLPTTLEADGKAQTLQLANASKMLWFGIISFLHQAVAEAGAPKKFNA